MELAVRPTSLPGARKFALKTGDPDDMALAESMLAASNHLLGNHIIAQQHCESGLRYSGRLVLNAIDVQQRVGKFPHMPALFRRSHLGVSIGRGLLRGGSLLSAIDRAKRQSAALFELKAAMNLAELLLKQDRVPEAYKYLHAALDRMPAGIVSPDHARALQVLSRLQSGTEAVG